MGKYEGRSTLALRPKSAEQMSQVLAHCNRRKLAVVPQVRRHRAQNRQADDLMQHAEESISHAEHCSLCSTGPVYAARGEGMSMPSDAAGLHGVMRVAENDMRCARRVATPAWWAAASRCLMRLCSPWAP